MKQIYTLFRVLLLSLTLGLLLPLRAGEGIWLPLLLETLNESEMQSMGLKIKAEDIYSINKSSLKDAVVRFGSGCTGEIVSPDGLLFTNHHCGFSSIVKHSSLENDYLKLGYWAKNRSEELPNPGLTVTFIVRIEDVSQQVLAGISPSLDEAARAAEIRKRISAITAKATEGSHYQAEVKPFYYGNEYYLFVTEVFRDVRLVGAPPSSLGNYGGETDNWVWPRHTADFSVFRVYAGPDGKPADYSADNVPMKPRHFLPVSLKGVNEGDFTMVYGFPGRTQEYLTSYAVDMVMSVQDPLRISLRDKRLTVFDREMRESDAIRLMYADKQKGVANAYKKWKGEVRGLKRDNAVAKKEAVQAEFMRRLATDTALSRKYGSLLDEMKGLYVQLQDKLYTVEYFNEGALGIELIEFCLRASRMVQACEKATTDADREKAIANLRAFADGFFSHYSASIDEEIAAAILRSYDSELPAAYVPAAVKVFKERHKGDLTAYTKALFGSSLLADKAKFDAWLGEKKFDPARFYTDPAYELMAGLYQPYQQALPEYEALAAQVERKQRSWMQALREVFPERRFYPDANLTLRLSYGKMEGMQAADALYYIPYTTLEGAMEKYKPGDYDFDLPPAFIELYRKKDYGRYGKNGEMRTCFIASNHTTGGNSGSPVLNGDGHLIGINFDRNWEGTMSDINYDVKQCRNISVDARYVLFIIDKFAGAGYLLEEMTLVE